MPEDLKYHEENWLLLQEKIVQKQYVNEDQKRAFLDQQNYHAERYCSLQVDTPIEEVAIIKKDPPLI